MRKLLLFTLFVCSFVFIPFAQEKGEIKEKESKQASSMERESSMIHEELKRDNQKVEIKSSAVKVESIEKSAEAASSNVSKKGKLQQDEVVGHKPLPKDFPNYIDTGDPEKDQQDYWSRREEWIEKNQELYKSYFTTKESSKESQNVTPQKISIK